MKVEQFLVGSIGTNAYLMIQEETKECLAVDLGGCPGLSDRPYQRERVSSESNSPDSWTF